MIGRIIVPVSGTRRLESKLDHAFALAGHFGSRIDVLFLHGAVDPQSIEYNPVLETDWDAAEIQWAEEGPALSNVMTGVDRWSKATEGMRDSATAGGSRANVTFIEIRGDHAQALQNHGRTSDLIVIGQPQRGMGLMEREIAKLSVMESGRLVLVTPNDPPPVENILTHVLIAWDGGAQVSATVGLSMPIIGIAQRMTVYTAENSTTPKAEHALLKDYLGCNGITADFMIDDHASDRIGGAMLEAAKSRGVSLICMGAYERSRTAEILIGGNTRHVYTRSRLPILLSA
jgi:nucleotide-binding universal stress UspA family protein